MSAFNNIFCEAEQKAMEFLVSKHGFRPMDRKVFDDNGSQYVGGIVTYVETLPPNETQNQERFVTLSVAPLRLELDLDIGIGKDKRQFYTIYELHQLEQGGEFPHRQHNLYEAINNTNQLLAEFEILTKVLQNFGSRFFAGDKSLWDDLRKQRLSQAQTRNDFNASRDAEKAFKMKQWKKVIGFLENQEPRLTKVDIARLQYARKQLGKN